MKIAKERKSSVLASNAIHHRIDSLTSIVALATIGGAHIITDASWLDPVGGLLISLMVIRAGWGNTLTSLLELADVTVDTDVKTSVRRAATKAIKGDSAKGVPSLKDSAMIEVKDVQGIKSGQNYLVDVEVTVPSGWSLQQLTEIEDAVRERTGAKVRGVRRVRVKFISNEQPSRDFAHEFIGAEVSPRSSPEPEADDHDHQHQHVNGSANHEKKAK